MTCLRTVDNLPFPEEDRRPVGRRILASVARALCPDRRERQFPVRKLRPQSLKRLRPRRCWLRGAHGVSSVSWLRHLKPDETVGNHSAEIDLAQSGVSRNTDEHLVCAGHNRPQRPAWKEEFHRTDGTNTEGLIVRTQQSAGIEKQIRTLTFDARRRSDFQL